MEITWQDIAVWAIGILTILIIARRLFCLLRGDSKCSSCSSSHCPLKGMMKK